MSSRIILVTGVGGDIGQSIIKCLKDCNIGRSIRILGCDIDSYSAGKSEVESFFQSPKAIDSEEYKTFMDNIITKIGIHYIIPTSEPEIHYFSQNGKFFVNRVIALINKACIIDTFSNKFKTIEFLKAHDVPCPQTYRISEYNNELDFPVLVKREQGYGGKGQRVVRDKEEMELLRKRENDAIVQEIIGQPDEEYTLGVFSTGKVVYSIAFHRYLGYGSLSKVARLICDVKLEMIAKKVALASGLEGSFNIQLRKTAKGYIPFEINPRFSSTVYMRHHFGFRDVEWWLNLHEGREPKYVPQYKSGVGVRKLSEVFFSCEPL